MIYECTSIAKSVKDVLTKDKGSKFLGYAYPVNNEDDVKRRLQEVKEKHPQATHHCYAYRLGFEGENYRANDDGEPNGTAGLPIYNQLLSFDYTFILLVVVRYYGGTKLGVSGLIKAYKQSAEETLEKCKKKTIEKTAEFELKFPYTSQNSVMRIIDRNQAEIIEQTYLENCFLKIKLPKKNAESFLGSFESLPDVQVNEIT